ncbi:MAG: type II secretion system protein [Acidobacteriota bacterium]
MKQLKIKLAKPELAEKILKGHSQRGERGYALIAIVGVMMFALILTTVAAPQVKKETQREREEEMLWRGEQVSSGIARYFRENGGRWPLGEKGIRELAEGIQSANQIGAKKKKYIRPSALCDPMTPCPSGTINWRLVYQGDPLAKELYEAYDALRQKAQLEGVPMRPPEMLAQLELMARAGGMRLPGDTSATNGNGTGNGQGDSQNGDLVLDGKDNKDKETLPVIGVVSRKTDRMFRSYYGIDEYDHALFFPTIPVQAGGFISPLALAGGLLSGGSAPENRCPDGGVKIGGKCYGGLVCPPGACCPPRHKDANGNCVD